jgi:hypothetical protein
VHALLSVLDPKWVFLDFHLALVLHDLLKLNDSVFSEPLNALHLVLVEVELLLNGLVNRELALFE